MMDVPKGNCAVQMGVAMYAKLVCHLKSQLHLHTLAFVILKGESIVWARASLLVMDVTHGKLSSI